MIIGTVNARFEIVVKITVRNATGTEHEVDAVLDTGYNSSLTLPPALVAKLALPWWSNCTGVLADGSAYKFDVYTATVLWDGLPRSIYVEAVGGVPLIGMTLLKDHNLRAQVIVGGNVEIEKIP